LYAPALFRYAYRLGGTRALAEDLVQETFLEAWKSMARQSDERGARGWLFQILRRRFGHYLRDSRRYRKHGSLAEDSEGNPAGRAQLPLDVLAEQDAMQTALKGISPIIRETFLMVFAEGKTCRETAQTLGIPLGTVLSRLDSGRRALRMALGEKKNKGGNLPIQGKDQAAL
jgi:RNA polymerase sigma-70 factor (ECF subfamily)